MNTEDIFIEIKNEKIYQFEKGNMLKYAKDNTIRPVCAISIKGNYGYKIKAIFKEELAVKVNTYMNERRTIGYLFGERISFKGKFREIRYKEKELILDNISNLIFNVTFSMQE